MRLAFLFFVLILSLFLNIYYLWNNHSTKPTNTLQLSNEIKNYGVFCVGEERPDVCYWFSNGGVVTNEAATIVGNIVKINEVSDFRPALGKQFLDDYLWKNMTVIIEFLKGGKLDVKNLLLLRNDQDLIVTTNDEKIILFSLRFSPKNNIIGLLSYLDKGAIKNASQIDLRVENKIFYK